MRFQTLGSRAGTVKFQQPLLHKSFYVKANGTHVAQNLALRFLERQIEARVSPRRHAAAANAMASVLFPVPAPPEISTLLPR